MQEPCDNVDAEDLLAGVGMGVEVDQADRAEAVPAGPDVGLGDRVVAAEHDRDRARGEDLADRRSIASWDRAGSAGRTGASPKSTTRSTLEGVDAGLEVRARAGSSRRGSPAGRTGSPGGRRRGRPSARRRSRRRRPRARPGPRCTASRRRSGARRSRASHRAPASARGDRSRGCNLRPRERPSPAYGVGLGSAPP